MDLMTAIHLLVNVDLRDLKLLTNSLDACPAHLRDLGMNQEFRLAIVRDTEMELRLGESNDQF